MNFEDTIGAIATPPGKGGIGVIRISGLNALAVADLLFQGEQIPSKVESHTVHYGKCVKPDTGEVLDEVLCVIMKKPRTYTKEDVVEFQTHGSVLLMQEILEEAFRLGVRPAEPGEFTLRAYINGRLDLTQAEAVADLINAETAWARKSALSHLLGNLQKEIKEIRARLVSLLALYEAQIDFYEEDIELVDKMQTLRELNEIREKLHRLILSFGIGRLVREGARVGIFGLVNVGKSSVFNALLGTDRAIVHKEPGTTRDLVEGELIVGGLLCRLVDTAGFRGGAGEVEEEGLRRAALVMKETDIAVFVVDAAEPKPAEEEKVYNKLISHLGAAEKIIVAQNKTDLLEQPSKTINHGYSENSAHLTISALRGWGINNLKDLMNRALIEGGTPHTSGIIITNTRHYYILSAVKEAVEKLTRGVEEKRAGELLALDFREAIDRLGEITGESIGDEVLQQIFSKFCIGK